MSFRRVARENIFARVALEGPPGSGKTATGLLLALSLAEGGPVACIDTERGSMRKYLGEQFHGIRIPPELDIDEFTDFPPSRYTAAVQNAVRLGYRALLIDSWSHAWEGTGGALDMVDRIGARAKGGNFSAWREVTPLHREMVDTILGAPLHVVCTMRMKMEYAVEQDGPRMKVKKLGMRPIQREGVEYEFDLVIDMEAETNRAVVAKTRCSRMFGRSAVAPSPEFFTPFVEWLKGGNVSQAATMNPSWVPQPENAPTYDLAGPCTVGQQETIGSLAHSLGMEPDDLRAVLAKRGASRRADLTYQQADELIGKMTQRLAEAEGVPF